MRSATHLLRRRLPVLMLAVVGLGLTACGSSGKSSSSTAAEAPVVAVTANEYSYNLPPTIPGGVVKLTLTNAGQESHDFQLLTVDGTHTKAEILQVLSEEDAPTPPWLHAAGGVGTIPPGGPPASAYVKLKANSEYWYVCTDTTDDGKPHAGEGMVGSFKTDSTSEVSEFPDAPASVTAKDYAFDIKAIKSGEQLVTFTNDGPAQIHHIQAFPLMPGKTLDDAKASLAQDGPPAADAGPPPIDFEKGVGTAALDPGVTEVTSMTFQAGSYVFVCFISDRAGGPPHFTKGMITEYKAT